MRDKNKKMIIGDFYSPPLMQRDGDGIPHGALISIANEIARSYGFDILFEELTQEMLNRFADSNIDIGLGVFNCKSRESNGDFSMPILEYKIQALASLPDIVLFEDLFIMPNIKIAVKEGDIGYNLLSERLKSGFLTHPNILVIPEECNENLVDVMSRGECNVVISDSLTLNNIRNSLGFPTYYPFEKELGTVDMCLMVNKKSPLGIKEVNRWFSDENNFYLVKRYLKGLLKQHPDFFIQSAEGGLN
jgi:hypothetical protein